MQKYTDNVVNKNGAAISGASVTVRDAAGNLATLYSDDGVTTQANPVSTDAKGVFSFYAADGTYTVTVTGSRIGTSSKIVTLISEASVATYAALRAFAGTSKTVNVTGYLASAAPSGIAGIFTCDDDDTTSADNGGTIIVASNGKRWKRVFSGAINVQWFGAVGDGTTDDYAAFQAAIDSLYPNGGSIHVPKTSLRYRISDQLVFTTQIKFYGDGAHENPGTVDGESFPFPTLYQGTVLYFDTGAAGLQFYDCTDVSVTAFLAGDSSVKFKYPGARRSVVRDMTLLSADNGALPDIGSHGIESRTQIFMDNVSCIGFRGDGIRIIGSTDAEDPWTTPYGNVSLSQLRNCRTRVNGGRGLYIAGRDANVIGVYNHDSALNGSWGFEDNGLAGNLYSACHAATNNTALTADADLNIGSFKASSAVGRHVYHGCYVEGGNGRKGALTVACEVVGGNLGDAGDNWASAEPALIATAGTSVRKGWRSWNFVGAADVLAGTGVPPTGVGNVPLWWGSTDDAGGPDADGYKLHRNFVFDKTWELVYANSVSARLIQFIGNGHADTALESGYAVGFPSGIVVGSVGSAPRLLPAQNVAPSAGTYRRGDFVLNTEPSISGGKVLLGWSRLTNGSGHVAGTDWTPCYVTTS
jgi:hypothetical protein